MSDSDLVVSGANVAKYMALLESEKDLKNKLQQMFLKKKADETNLQSEIDRLSALLEDAENANQAVVLSEPVVNQDCQELENQLTELQTKFSDISRKLVNCRNAYLDLDAKNNQNQAALEEKNKEVVDLKSLLKDAEKSQNVSEEDLKFGKDDLTMIKGIGPKLKNTLYDLGITSFDEIAAWKAADINRVEEGFKLKGRIKRDEWVKQAKKLKSAK